MLSHVNMIVLVLPNVYILRGNVVMMTGEGEAVLYSDVDLGSVQQQFPVSTQKRHDVYQVVGIKEAINAKLNSHKKQ